MSLSKSKKRQSGFTLIEMIVVITILGILAVISLSGYSGYLRRGRVTRAATDAAALASAINVYNTSIGTPLIGATNGAPVSSSTIEADLTGKNLLPSLSASSFADALKNVVWDASAKLWIAKPQPYDETDLTGY